MLPTVIVVGLVFGRWWRTTVLVAAVGWAVLLAAQSIIPVEAGPLAAAGGLAAASAAVGVAVNRAAAGLWARIDPPWAV